MLLSPKDLHRYLLGWYDAGQHAARDMPWRKTRDPYAIWLSETMLQQTQVTTVKPYYHKFLERFPTVSDLAAADLQEVLSMWAGLGYYRRAKHLHLAAQQIVLQHSAELPGTAEQLIKLPGIGRYTAGAVASIAFGQPSPVVDGNVMRVLSRLTGYDQNIADPKNAPFFWTLAQEILIAATSHNPAPTPPNPAVLTTNPPTSRPQPRRRKGVTFALPQARFGDINQALMELGATVCTPPPSRPSCLVCPVKKFCRAFAEGRQMELPVKEKKGATPVVRGVAVIVLRETARRGNGESAKEVLLMQRPGGVVWESMWEFPVLGKAKHETRNAKQSGSGAKANFAARVESELGIKIGGVKFCGEVRHQLTHRLYVYEVVTCETARGRNGESAKGLKLPVCEKAKAYGAWQWAAWPLEEKGEIPLGNVVRKIYNLL